MMINHDCLGHVFMLSRVTVYIDTQLSAGVSLRSMHRMPVLIILLLLHPRPI